MFYTVYKTTNKINGKFYVGCHKTSDLDDSYLGSGKLLRRAIEKHGIENFEREILHVFDNPEEMFAKEKEIVTEEFLSENNTYNLKLGGEGGFDYIINDKKLMADRNRKIASNRDYSDKTFRNKVSEKVRLSDLEGRRRHPNNYPSFAGKKHSSLSKEKIGSANKRLTGSKNSQFGSFWITNGVESKKCRGQIPEGWRRGRKRNMVR